MEFDWDEANVSHIARHGINPTEVEEALSGEIVVDLFDEIVDEEMRFGQLGVSRLGRILVVVTTDRNGKTRPVTAYDASPRRKKLWQEVMVNYVSKIDHPNIPFRNRRS